MESHQTHGQSAEVRPDDINDSCSMQYHAPCYWGLDPMFQTYCKMYIKDILDLKTYSHSGTGVFAYKNHPVLKVDVMGMVVRVEEREKLNIYAVDDGTGVINCCCWKNEAMNSLVDTHVPGLSDCVKGAQEHDEASLDCQLGDLLHVRGKIKVFRDMKQISASFFSVIQDPNQEVARILELPKLYQEFYDKPFKLPKKVANELDAGVQVHYVKNLKQAIETYLKSNSMNSFYIHELEDIQTLQESLPAEETDVHTLYVQAVRELELDGLVGRSSKYKELYQVFVNNVKLEQAVLDILSKETSKPQFCEKGCHYLHILSCLHQTVQFNAVSEKGLLVTLSRLEEDSRVISTTEKHYVPCSS